MTQADVPDYDVIQHPPAEPIVLVGPPASLAGELLLRNDGPDKLVLRDVLVRGEAIARLPGLAGGTSELALRRVVLRPGQLRRMPLQLALSPNTPPGEYHAEVQVGGRVRQIVLQVTELVRLEIDPDPVVVENIPGETSTKRVVFSNRGNVPLRIGEIGGVVLDEEAQNCRAGRAAVMNTSETAEGLDQFLGEYVRQTRAVVSQIGLLRVHNTAGPFTLAPGDVRAVEMQFRVPDKLDQRARYFGAVALYTSNLNIVITPTHADRPARPSKRRSAE
jgi:hypothetical protein